MREWVYLAHVTGALVTFTAGTAVSGLQAWITYLMHPEVVDMWIFWIRIFIAFVSVGTYISAIVVGKLAHIERACKELMKIRALLIHDFAIKIRVLLFNFSQRNERRPNRFQLGQRLALLPTRSHSSCLRMACWPRLCRVFSYTLSRLQG